MYSKKCAQLSRAGRKLLSLLKECVVGELGGVGGLNKESSLVENDEIIAAFSLGSPGPRGCQLRDN